MESERTLHTFGTVEDIDRFIIMLEGSPAWLSLKDKTQVFNLRKTQEVKTRGSHSDDVGRIASLIAEGMGATPLQVMKSRLIGLLHDLGHIPYGHAGEAIADAIIKKHEYTPEELRAIGEIRNALFGENYNAGTKKRNKKTGELEESLCFEHNENSVVQFIMLCRKAGFEIDQEIVLGILAHSTSRYTKLPPELCQQAVRIADKLAYINYDINDLLISFSDSPEVKQALDDLYSKPLTVTNPLTGEKETVRIIINGKEITMYEFSQMKPEDKITLFIEETVKDAKSHQGRITGCNDLIVEVSGLKKKKDKLEKERDKFPEESTEYQEKQQEMDKIQHDMDVLYYELYKRNPILYAAYELKERSDNFIRAGVGLTVSTQVKKTWEAESAVGNKDLEKEYIYKQLVTIIEKNLNGIDPKENYTEEEKRVISEFVSQYKKYKEEEDNIIRTLPGNKNGVTYPQIYSIVNFIGTFTNSQLDIFAAKLRIIDNYEAIVLPELQSILTDEKLYNPITGLLTDDGRKKREEIVSKHGAIIRLRYGVEEESISPKTADEIIELLRQKGYDLDSTEYVGHSEQKTDETQQELDEEEKKQEEFRAVAQRKENEFVGQVQQITGSLQTGRSM